MNTQVMTFGKVISDARKQAQLSQKDLAKLILKEDGVSISPQYLNDIEHDRRNPDSDSLIKQFSKVLKIPEDVLYFYSARIPSSIVGPRVDQGQIVQAYKAFRKAIKS